MNILKKIIKINIILMIILISAKANMCYVMAGSRCLISDIHKYSTINTIEKNSPKNNILKREQETCIIDKVDINNEDIKQEDYINDADNKEMQNEEIKVKEIKDEEIYDEEIYDEDTYIEELIDLLNFSNVDKVSREEGIVFSEIVYKIVKGGDKNYLKVWLSEFTESIRQQFVNQKGQIKTIIIIAVISAFIANVQNVFVKAKVTDASFYIIILMLAGVISTGFITIYKEAVEICAKMTEFMKVLLPAYFLSVTLVDKTQMMPVYYEIALLIIWLVNVIISGVLLKMPCLYMLITYINEITGTMFGKMAELVKDLVTLALKTMFGIMMGINVIQGLIVPVSAELQNSTLIKAGGAIPGVGNTISTVTNTVLVAAKLVKNAVGVAGVIAVFLLCAVPLLKLLFWQFGYQLVAAVVQPVSEPRVIRCLGAVKESLALLVRAVAFGAMLFIASILVISSMT